MTRLINRDPEAGRKGCPPQIAQIYTDLQWHPRKSGSEIGKLICANLLICGAVRFVRWNCTDGHRVLLPADFSFYDYTDFLERLHRFVARRSSRILVWG